MFPPQPEYRIHLSDDLSPACKLPVMTATSVTADPQLVTCPDCQKILAGEPVGQTNNE